MLKEEKRIDYNLTEYLLHPFSDDQNLAAIQIKQMIDEMPGGFFVYRADQDKKILYANKAMYQLLNCSTKEEFQELTHNSFRGIVYSGDWEDVEKTIAEQTDNHPNNLNDIKYRIVQKGGSIRWIDDYRYFVRSKNKEDIFYVFAGEKTQYREEMKRMNQKQLRHLEIIEGLSIDYESIFYVDLDKNTIQPYRVSSRLKKQFGEKYSFKEFNGFDKEYISTWVYEEDKEILSKVTNPEYIREKLADEKSFYVYYQVIDGENIEHLQLRVVDVGKDDHISQIILGYRSIDKEVRHEMEQKELLKIALEQAKSAIAVKNTFLSNMSHDIRTPMNAIIGFAALAKHSIDDQEKLTQCLNQIESSGTHLMNLLHDILEISRIESGTVSVEHEACSLRDILESVERKVLPWAKEKEISVTFDYSDIRHDGIYSDPQKLSQILLRLASNAVKYTENHGNISIIITEQTSLEDYAIFQFVVEDNGIGIDEHFLSHIYEPFERQKNTTLSKIQGTGLGLTITKNLVEMMGGTIQISSSLGKGSRFLVTLSLSIQHKQEPPQPDSDYSSFTYSPPKRILLVEDNQLNLEIEVELLQDAGFLLDTAEDGSIAVDKVKQAVPGYYDVILMDIQMPVMDGYQATRIIRSLSNPAQSKIPIIALSANVFDEDRKKSMESGMNLHLAKPIDLLKLLKAIHQMIQSSAC